MTRDRSKAASSRAASRRRVWWGFRALRAVFVEDLKTKAIALVMALLIWAFVTDQISDQRSFRVAVKVEVFDPSQIVAEGSREDLEVILEGPRGEVASIRPDSLARVYRVRPDRLSDEKMEKTIEVRAEDLLDLPPGVRLVSVRPESVELFLQKVSIRQVKIEARVVGEVADGFRLGEVQFSPAEVKVRMPTRLVRNDHVWSSPIRIEGRDRTFSQTVQIDPRLDGGRVRQLDDLPILARVWIHEIEDEVEVVLPVLMLRPPDYPLRVKSIDPTEVVLRVSGPRRLLADRSSWKAFIDLRDLDPDRIRGELEFPHLFPLRFELPEGVKRIEAFIRVGADRKERKVEKVEVVFVEL